MLKPVYLLIFLFTGVFIFSCTSNHSPKASDSVSEVKKKNDSIVDGGIPIFYNMYLSVEMSSLFQSIGAIFNPDIINSPEKSKLYDISTDKAINLGVYAVDLSYAKYFDQFELAGKYLKNMQKLSSELGIPSEKFYISLKRIENNLTNKDSLVKIANEIYKTTEEHLKKNERGSAAALIIAGGWTEAMYIATSLVKKNVSDQELIARIAEQKHSILDLMQLLQNYQTDMVVKDLLVKFTDIKESLDLLNIAENEKDLYVQLSEVTSRISSLRKELVN